MRYAHCKTAGTTDVQTRAYEPQAVPGLLQTEDYIRALTTANFPGATGEEIERRVALRLVRQELLRRPAPVASRALQHVLGLPVP